VGSKPNGFTSVSTSHMAFYDTSGANLYVGLMGVQAHGNGMWIGNDDASALEIRLTGPADSLSIAFGNDDPYVVHKTDLARLTLYRGATRVGRVSVKLNGNDVMDQSIGTSGGEPFDRATFQFVNSAGIGKHLTEIVDNIALGPLCTITGTAGANHLVGTSGKDVICGGSGKDLISGGGGDDLIYGGPGKDRVSGGKGKDVIYGGSGKDRLSGGAGKDHISGDAGKDRLSGGSGKDQLRGGKGTDHCDGGKGHDIGKSCEIRSKIP
jgi:Ca2+-binding RTX toxin-like protein